MSDGTTRDFIPQPGWINRQVERARKDVETWPEWMKQAALDSGNKVPWGLYGDGYRPKAIRAEKVLLLQAGDIRAEIRHDDPFEQRLDALVDFVMAVSKKREPSMDGL